MTTALPERAAFLRRLRRHAPWIAQYEWIVCGHSDLTETARELGAIFVPADANVGTARNYCADRATGDIVVQLDDDDWQSPDRVRRQVFALTHEIPGKNTRPEVVGSSWLYCLNSQTALASRISYWDHPFTPGATLAYWRSSWKRHPFEPIRTEDGPFTSFFCSEGTCLDTHDPKLLVYMRHVSHQPEQRDWWYETRSRQRKVSVLDVMQERIKNPGRPLFVPLTETPRDLALAHEEEAATVYVRWLMGDDFDRFVQAPDVGFPG